MRKKLLTLAGAIALFSNVSMVKAVEDLSWGLNVGIGTSVNAAEYRAAATIDKKQLADKDYFGGASLFLGYNFSEIFGVEINLGARILDGFNIKDEQNDAEQAAEKAVKSLIEADVTNVTLDVLLTFIPIRYLGGFGCIRISLGPQLNYALLKSVKIGGTVSEEAAKIIRNANVDLVLKANASFIEDIISAGVILNYTAFDQIDADAVKTIKEIKNSTVKFGAGKWKVGASIGLNIAAMIS